MIELTKGQEWVLATEDGQPLTRLRMGVGWDKERTAGFIGTGRPDVDLDASAVEFAGGQLADAAFYNNLETRDGSLVHLGDNLTGSGEGDDSEQGGPSAEQQRANDDLFFLRMLKPFTSWRPDVEALRAGPVRVRVAVGATTGDELARRSAEALAARLGQVPAVFPSHHAGFMDDPVGFAAEKSR